MTFTYISLIISALISTHTLRKEGDSAAVSNSKDYVNISTHTLRKEGDTMAQDQYKTQPLFQPTPSARRVTTKEIIEYADLVISTHTLRKEGDVKKP